jgi:hypothetical protein
MTKLTKKVALSLAIANLKNGEFPATEWSTEEVVAKLSEMVDALEKKTGAEKPLTEQQKQNLSYKTDLLAVLIDGKARTATELMKEVPTFPADMSNQRVSQLLRQLILDGKVKKETVKGKTLFSIVEGV